jgi:hypothetical protein
LAGVSGSDGHRRRQDSEPDQHRQFGFVHAGHSTPGLGQ